LVGANIEKLPEQLGRLAPDFAYRRPTLRPESWPNKLGEAPGAGAKPWTAKEVLEDVLLSLCGRGGYSIGADLKLGNLIEGLELHESGADALSRVLSFVPGAKVFIGHDGLAHVASTYDNSEVAAFEGQGAPYSGDWSLVDRSLARSRVFWVFSDREVELRFDHVEERNLTSAQEQLLPDGSTGESLIRTVPEAEDVDGGPGREEMWIQNVIINPLYNLPLDSSGDKVATQGEAVELGKFLDGVALMDFDGFEQAPPLTKQVIRQHFLGNWAAFSSAYTRRKDQQHDPQRAKVLAAIRTHFRQTYQIKSVWMDKIRAIQNNRVGVLDIENGVRAPAAVFTQYLAKSTQLGYSPKARAGTTTRNDDWAEDISEKDISPFEVQIIDSDMGIIRIAPKLDQTGLTETYVIGDTKNGLLPSADLEDAAVFWNQVHLAKEFKLAIILTASQESPNSFQRLHRQEVTLAEAAERLGIPTPTAVGPDMEMIQTAEPARFGWKDDDAKSIRDAFFDGKPYPPRLLMNRYATKEVATATAAQRLAMTLDRVEGRAQFPLVQIDPTGNLRSVVHTVSVGRQGGGALTTTLIAPGEVHPPSAYTMMPEGVRRKIRRLVDQ
jgi:hypothetical protein